jgi:hypothetical protein
MKGWYGASIEYQENEKIIPHYSNTSRTYIPVFCGCWIYFSGKLINLLTNDPHIITEIETYKGFAFVLVTTIYCTWNIRKRLAQLEAEHEALLAVQQELTREEIKYRNLSSNRLCNFCKCAGQDYPGQPACLALFGAKSLRIDRKMPMMFFTPHVTR